MRTVGVARKLDLLAILELQGLLEVLANLHQDRLALFDTASLAASMIAFTTAGNGFTDSARPETDAVKALADVDDHAHDFAVVLVFERLTDGAEHDVQPGLVDVDGLLLFELVGPFAAVLVLGIFPFGPHAGLEEMVVGFESELGGGSDVVLQFVISEDRIEQALIGYLRRCPKSLRRNRS